MKKQLLFIPLIFCSSIALAQNTKEAKIGTQDSTVQKKVDFNVMPYISYNRNLKFMIGAIPMAMYRINQADTISPKSLSGLSAVYTTNRSYFIALFNRWYLAEDTWRLKMFAVNGDHNSQFYMDDLDAPGFYDYGTKTSILSVGVQRRIAKKFLAGVSYTYSHYDTDYEDDVQPESKTQTNGIELNLMLDTRDEVYYPMTGVNSKIRYIAYPEWFGNDVAANKILTEYNRYFPMKNGKDVLAARFSGKFGLGDIAFEQQVTLGGKDIRGYSQGKYRGDGQMALQGEYRYNFGEKMGVVGFAGLATIYGSDTESFNWKMYPGLGVGYRYRAFKTVKFNIGLDAAVGKDDWGIYFRIGEAF